jgi:hypothetical protein
MVNPLYGDIGGRVKTNGLRWAACQRRLTALGPLPPQIFLDRFGFSRLMLNESSFIFKVNNTNLKREQG